MLILYNYNQQIDVSTHFMGIWYHDLECGYDGTWIVGQKILWWGRSEVGTMLPTCGHGPWMDKFLSAGPYSYSGKNVSGKIFHGSFAHLKSYGSYEYYDIAQRDHFQNPADVSVGFFCKIFSSTNSENKKKRNRMEHCHGGGFSIQWKISSAR